LFPNFPPRKFNPIVPIGYERNYEQSLPPPRAKWFSCILINVKPCRSGGERSPGTYDPVFGQLERRASVVGGLNFFATILYYGSILVGLGETIYFLIGGMALLRKDLEKVGRNISKYFWYVVVGLVLQVILIPILLSSTDAHTISKLFGLGVALLAMIPFLLPYYFLWRGRKLALEGNFIEAGQFFKIYAIPYIFARLSAILFISALNNW
jgi:hypothetical protein